MLENWELLLEKARKGVKVRTHSSSVQPGDIFVALPGSRVDGDLFIPQALEKGAGFVVCQKCPQVPQEFKDRIYHHPDPKKALGDLASAHFGTGRGDLYLIGITGTNGKTTVSFLLEQMLGQTGRKVGMMGTVLYRWPGYEQEASLTTPGCLELHEMLRKMKSQGVDTVCMEVSSHALQQDRTAGLSFNLAVFTNLSQDHLDYHLDMQSYFAAKSRLFEIKDSRGPEAVINFDDPYAGKLAGISRSPLGFTLRNSCSENMVCLRGKILSASPEGLHLGLRFKDKVWELRSPLIGCHNASNLLAAQAVGIKMGLSENQLAAVSELRGVPGRLERVENSKGFHIFIDYAHSPDALESVLSAVRGITKKRLLVVFGCGGDRDQGKRPLMGRAVAKYADVAVLTSDNPRHEDPEKIMDQIRPGLECCTRIIEEVDRRRAIQAAINELQDQDVLIIAGKGHESYQQFGDEKIPFSDLAAVKEVLGASSQNSAQKHQIGTV